MVKIFNKYNQAYKLIFYFTEILKKEILAKQYLPQENRNGEGN